MCVCVYIYIYMLRRLMVSHQPSVPPQHHPDILRAATTENLKATLTSLKAAETAAQRKQTAYPREKFVIGYVGFKTF